MNSFLSTDKKSNKSVPPLNNVVEKLLLAYDPKKHQQCFVTCSTCVAYDTQQEKQICYFIAFQKKPHIFSFNNRFGENDDSDSSDNEDDGVEYF